MTSNTGGRGFVQLHFDHMTGWEQKGKAPQAAEPSGALGCHQHHNCFTFTEVHFYFSGIFFPLFKPFLAWVTQDNISLYNTDLVLIYTQQTYKLLKKKFMEERKKSNNTTTTWPHVPCSSAPVVSTFVPQIHPLACRRGWEGAMGDAGGMHCWESWNPLFCRSAPAWPGLYTYISVYAYISFLSFFFIYIHKYILYI